MGEQLFAQMNTHDFMMRIFTLSDARASTHAYIEAVIGNAATKIYWQMSEAEEFQAPYRFQHLLGRAVWDTEMYLL